MTTFQSTWLQLDISPYSYQSYSVIILLILYLAVPLFTATGCFCLVYYATMIIMIIKVLMLLLTDESVHYSPEYESMYYPINDWVVVW